MNYFPIAILISVASVGAQAQASDPCKIQKDTQEINECGKKTLREKDKQLDVAFQKLMKTLAPPDRIDDTDYASVRKQLTEAQRAWITYRDNDCKAKLTLNPESVTHQQPNCGKLLM